MTARINHTPFHLHHQHKTTIQGYALPAAHLVAALLRRQTGTYVFNTSPALLEGIKKLSNKQDLASLHGLFKALWFTSWPSTANTKFPDPTIAFLGLYTLQQKGDFAHPKDVTGIITKLCRTVQLTVLKELHVILKTPGTDEHTVLQGLARWIKAHETTTFSDLLSLQKYATSISLRTLSLPKVLFPNRGDNNYDVMMYEGQQVEITQVQKILANLQNEIVELWEQKILMGLKCHVSYNLIMDALNNTNAGYSFFGETSNPFASQRDVLAQGLFSSPSLLQRFTINIGEGQWVLNIHAAREWLQDLAKLELKLLISVEMKSGAPIRMTELASTLVKNRNTRVRNIMAVGRHLTLIGQYSKTSNLDQFDKMVPHALCGFDQDMFIQVHTYARPLAMVCFYFQFQTRQH